MKGLEWGPASTGNAVWSGARLTDVLKLMGINDETEGFSHVKVSVSKEKYLIINKYI